MALAPRDTPITRDNVVQWYAGWKKSKGKETWEEYLRRKIDDLDISDPMIDTTAHDGMSNEVHVADMILADMDSYGLS